MEVEQLREISTIYLETDRTEKALSSLQDAYQLAINSGQTLEAKKILELLVEQYRQKKNQTKLIHLYNDFISKLDTLIKNDGTLIDKKFFQTHEEKITQLEKERTLKDELIVKKNRFNHVLQGSIFIILIFTLLIIKHFTPFKRKIKELLCNPYEER